MFGLSFGELLVCAILALVVLGPKELPTMLRTLGRTIAKLRRMTTDLRAQSGIDEIIREEGLHEELATLRSLRGISASSVVESFIEGASTPNARKAALLAAAAARSGVAPYSPDVTSMDHDLPPIALEGTPPEPSVEYPELGCDAYGARPPSVEEPTPAATPHVANEGPTAALPTEVETVT